MVVTWNMLKDGWTPLPAIEHTLLASHPDLSGQTVVITGANTGLGLETARHVFERLEPRFLILACRNVKAGEEAVQDILENSKIPSREQEARRIETWELDLTSFESVKAFAKRFKEDKDGGKLDVLVNNAAVALRPFALTEDGWECLMQTNVISTFLLTTLLLPDLRNAPSPRIVFVSSDYHYTAVFKERHSPGPLFSNMNDPAQFNIVDRYPTTKTLVHLLVPPFCRSLQSHDPSMASRVRVVTVNPGLVRTGLARVAMESSWKDWIFFKLMHWIVGKTPREAARTEVNAGWGDLGEEGATGGEERIPGQGTFGGFLSFMRWYDPSPFVLSQEGKETAERAWKEWVELGRTIVGDDAGYLLE